MVLDILNLRILKLHHWFKSYSNFAEPVDLANCWSCIRDDLRLSGFLLKLSSFLIKASEQPASNPYQGVRAEPVGEHHPLPVGVELVVILVQLPGLGAQALPVPARARPEHSQHIREEEV